MRDKQFKSKIDSKKASEGIKAANDTAKSLLDDAILLFENKRYARAIALAILSIEESGKPAILRSILLEDDVKEINECWKSYRRHNAKNTMWILPELISKGARHIEDMRQIVDKNSNHSQTLDSLKQLCFYSDAFTKCKWSIPDNVADFENAKSIIAVAKVSVSKNDLFNNELALDLWVKHLKPSWKKDMHLMLSLIHI